MNISYKWLKELIDFDLSAVDLAEALTRVGLTVEGIEAKGDDSVLDIDQTSNRPDCLSHLGVAREIGVIVDRPLRTRGLGVADVPYPAALAGEIVSVDDKDLCSRFTARIIRNVKVGHSPQWLVQRLEAIGERSINNIADITNYAMHDTGQPMHAFDLDKLAENRLVVRCARDGESIITLDEVERKLDPSMLAICDAEKPVAVAGIMGGLDSSISATTVNVLLEVAYFDRDSIRATSRKLNLATEASYRFERGVDIENLIVASARATELIRDLAGGEPAELIDIYTSPFNPKHIESRDISSAVARLTGLKVEKHECDRILSELGISSDETRESYASPSWRYDIAIEEDLVEEVARHTGYENIESLLPPAYGAGEFQPTEVSERLLRQRLVDLGYDEAITYSFISTETDDQYEPVPDLIEDDASEPLVTLRDSVIQGSVRMRPTVIPALLDALRTNFNQQRKNLNLFEIGRVFASLADGQLPVEKKVLGLVITGSETFEGHASVGQPRDFFDIKGALQAALDAVGTATATFSAETPKHLRAGQSAVVKIDSRPIGSVGRLRDDLAAQFKFKQPVFVAEIDLDLALSAAPEIPSYFPLPKYPGVVRDVTLLAPKTVTFENIVRSVMDKGDEILDSVDFVDSYEGNDMTPGERSLTIRLGYRSESRSLSDNEVDQVHNALLEAIKSETGAGLRQ